MENILDFLAMNSVYAAIVLAVVLVVRFLLRRAPKVFSYMLWAVVFARLLCPVSLNSEISIIPDFAELFSEEASENDVSSQQSGSEYAENIGTDTAVSSAQTEQASAAGRWKQSIPTVKKIAFSVWLCTSVSLLIWHALSLLGMKRKVSTATLKEGNVYESDRIATAFVSGIIRPKIYVPCGLEENRYHCILCHERCHIRRADHIIKPLAGLVCCVYWFDPLVWIAMNLMCRDMEQSCDEAVVSSIGGSIKGDYSRMLLEFGTAAPVAFEPAFGENNAKTRIKNVLSYRKPKKTIVALSAVAVAIAAVLCTGSNGSYAEMIDRSKAETEIYSSAKESEDESSYVKYRNEAPRTVFASDAEVSAYLDLVHGTDSEMSTKAFALRLKLDAMRIADMLEALQ